MGQTIDFVSFLAERGDARFDAFRAHYPRCQECSREVARWSQLQAALIAHAAEPLEHPAEERMVSFASRPDSLEQAARREISAHLDQCAACRSELRIMRDFDLEASVRAATSARRTETASPRWRPLQALRALAEAASEWLREPAFAAVAATLVVTAVGWLWLRAPAENTGPSPELQRAQTPPSTPVEIAGGSEGPEAGVEALEEQVPSARPDPVEESGPGPSRPSVEPDDSVRRIAARPERVPEAVAAVQPVPRDEPAAAPSAEPLADEAIRIAALLPEVPISYLAPASPLLGTGPVRSFGVSRARGPSASLELRVMAPEHVGWAAEATPTLYWQLSEATDLPLEITLLDDTQVEPLLEERREGPHEAGLQSLSLADLGLRLEAGVLYRWQVALVVDPQRRSKDVRSAAALVWKAPAVAPPPPTTPGRAHQFAASGYWYDAFAQLSAWLAAEPDAGNLRAARDALLAQVGLEPATDGRGR